MHSEVDRFPFVVSCVDTPKDIHAKYLEPEMDPGWRKGLADVTTPRPSDKLTPHYPGHLSAMSGSDKSTGRPQILSKAGDDDRG